MTPIISKSKALTRIVVALLITMMLFTTSTYADTSEDVRLTYDESVTYKTTGNTLADESGFTKTVTSKSKTEDAANADSAKGDDSAKGGDANKENDATKDDANSDSAKNDSTKSDDANGDSAKSDDANGDSTKSDDANIDSKDSDVTKANDATAGSNQDTLGEDSKSDSANKDSKSDDEIVTYSNDYYTITFTPNNDAEKSYTMEIKAKKKSTAFTSTSKNSSIGFAVNDAAYQVQVMYSWTKFTPVDITDADNPEKLDQHTYYWGTRWEGGYRAFYSWINMPKNYMIADTNSTFAQTYDGGWHEFDVNYIREQGPHTFTGSNSFLTVPQAADDKTPIYCFYDPKDKNGKSISYLTNGMYVPSGSKMYMDNNQQVWCIEPGVATYTDCKYESEKMDENIDAAAVVAFGDDTSNLKHIIMQGLVWNYTGSDFGDVTPQVYVNDPISDEDMTIIKDLKEQIEKAKALYLSNALADFQSKTPGVSIKDGKIVFANKVNKKDGQVVVLETKNKELLARYTKGTIKYSEGITGNVDLENGQLILNIDPSAIDKNSQVNFSMVPEKHIGETVRYYSNYGKQTLAAFRLADAKWETLGVNMEFGPDNPNSPPPGNPPENPPEKPGRPDVPNPPDNSDNPPANHHSSVHKDNSPVTGDNMNLNILMAVQLAALLGISALVMTPVWARRKRG